MLINTIDGSKPKKIVKTPAGEGVLVGFSAFIFGYSRDGDGEIDSATNAIIAMPNGTLKEFSLEEISHDWIVAC